MEKDIKQEVIEIIKNNCNLRYRVEKNKICPICGKKLQKKHENDKWRFS